MIPLKFLFLTVLLTFSQAVLLPVNIALPFLIYQAVNNEKSNLIIYLLAYSFLLDLLTNLPFGASLFVSALIMMIFIQLKEASHLNRIQTNISLLLAPLLWEILSKVYLNLIR